MSEPPPFLSAEKKAEYLERKGYGNRSEISGESFAFLGHINFHYFLGYARNYRALMREGKAPVPHSIDSVVGIVQRDHELSTLLFSGLKTFEWRLRAAVVESHCALYPSNGCFLLPDHFHMDSESFEPVEEQIRKQTVRSREPFLLDHYERKLEEGGFPRSDLTKLPLEQQMEIIQDLPIWAIIDNWSLGLLVRFVMSSKAPDPDGTRLFKMVASSFDVSAQIVGTQLDSLQALRNLVAHHSRLWMRPSTYTPKHPKLYKKLSRDCDPKSMYTVILTLATFLQAQGAANSLLTDVHRLLEEDEIFALGIKRPLTLRAPASPES